MKTAIAIVTVVIMTLMMLGIAPAASAAATNPNPSIDLIITKTQDTFIHQANPTNNYCFDGGVQVRGTSGSDTKRGLVQFSIADLPTNANVSSAKYFGYMNTADIRTSNGIALLAIYQLQTAWSECTVTWNNQPTQGGFLTVQGISNESLVSPQPFPFDITGFVRTWLKFPSTQKGIEFAFLTDTSAPFRELIWYSDNSSGREPRVVITYTLPTATIYPAYYCSGGPCETGILSGSGLPAYLFNITYAENNGTFRRAPRPDLLTSNISTYFTLRGSDFFGNLLFNQSKVVTSSPFLWLVQIPYGIFQVYSMRDTFTALSIKPSGGTPMVIDIPPRAWWVLPLKTGVSYYLNFTLLDANFNAIATINIVRTMSAKLSFIVNGTTLSQISINQNGNWQTTNETHGSINGIGNALLAPKGIDFFKDLTALPMFLFVIPVGTNVWTFLLAGTVIATTFFVQVYRNRLRRNVARWPLNMRASATLLVIFGFLLFLSAVLYITTGQFIIPFPISNA